MGTRERLASEGRWVRGGAQCEAKVVFLTRLPSRTDSSLTYHGAVKLVPRETDLSRIVVRVQDDVQLKQNLGRHGLR